MSAEKNNLGFQSLHVIYFTVFKEFVSETCLGMLEIYGEVEAITFVRHITAGLFQFPQISIRILFFIVMTVSGFLFEELDQEIMEITATEGITEDFQLSSQLENWKYKYNLVCNLVGEIQNFFGLIIFINIIWVFIESIVSFHESVTIYAFFIFMRRYDFPVVLRDLYLIEHSLHKLSESEIRYAQDYIYTYNCKGLLLQYYLVATTVFSRSYYMYPMRLFRLWFRLLMILIPCCRTKNRV